MKSKISKPYVYESNYNQFNVFGQLRIRRKFKNDSTPLLSPTFSQNQQNPKQSKDNIMILSFVLSLLELYLLLTPIYHFLLIHI